MIKWIGKRRSENIILPNNAREDMVIGGSAEVHDISLGKIAKRTFFEKILENLLPIILCFVSKDTVYRDYAIMPGDGYFFASEAEVWFVKGGENQPAAIEKASEVHLVCSILHSAKKWIE